MTDRALIDTLLATLAQRLPDFASLEAKRLLHGRGNTFAGLETTVIDWFPPLLQVTIYDSVPEELHPPLTDGLRTLFGNHLGALVLQQRTGGDNDIRLLYGELPQPAVAIEAGLSYLLDPLARQNVGYFPDMQTGRALVRERAAGKRVLNLFAYTCGFSVAALKGGAARVVNVDMNGRLLERGRRNHQLNGLDPRQATFLPHDVFKSFGRLRREGPYELVILDPPGFQPGSFAAERDWPKLLRRLPELLVEGGEVLAAVSAPELGRAFLQAQFAAQLPQAELLGSWTAGEDFPEADADKGLQLLLYRL